MLLRVGTDCSGIEAPIHALKILRVPFQHVWSCEIDPMVRASIDANYTPDVVYTDIFKRRHSELPHVDLYIAGFPCQTFSSLGKRQGFKDPRGTVFYECLKTIRHCLPKAFILENVKGLLTHDQGRTFDTIISRLRRLPHYTIHHKVLNTCDYGIPQHRERIYIVGIHGQTTFHFPPPVPLRLSVQDLLEANIEKDHYKKLAMLTPHKKGLLHDLLRSGRIDSLDSPWMVNLNVSTHERTGARKDICPCLLAGEGGNCVIYMTSIRRRLTPREYLRLQGFQDSFEINVPSRYIYKQAGNSMSVNVLCFLLQEIMRFV